MRSGKSRIFVRLQKAETFAPLDVLEKGLKTPTGKIELKSALIEQHPEWGLESLLTGAAGWTDPELYPVYDYSDTIPNAIHSRLHNSANNRSLRPVPPQI